MIHHAGLTLYACNLGCGTSWITEPSCNAQRALAQRLASKVTPRNLKTATKYGPSEAAMELEPRRACLDCPGCVVLCQQRGITPRVVPRLVREGQSRPKRLQRPSRNALLAERKRALLRERDAVEVAR